MTVPSAIEYILVTRLGGEGRRNNKEEVGVCIRVNRLALPEGGERKRNLTTTGLGEKQRKSETGPVPTKSSQSPLRIRSVQVEGVKELGSEEVTSKAGDRDHACQMAQSGLNQLKSQTIPTK